MSYIPTTEEVKRNYKGGAWLKGDRNPDQFNPAVYEPIYFAEFDSWYAEEIRKAKEEAWDEGFTLATRNTRHDPHPMAELNPYRKETE